MQSDPRRLRALTATMFLLSLDLVLFELLLTRLFGVVIFAQFAHLALALALLGISVGAIVQYIKPDLLDSEHLERRLAWVLLAQGVFTLIAVLCTVEFPITEQFETPPVKYQERSSIKDDLLDPFWFACLLPVLSVPFALAGWGFSAAFQHRKKHIGQLYGADLLGGAVGAVLFLPLLRVLAGPDTVFAITLFSAIAAGLLLFADGYKKALGGPVLLGMISVGALLVSASGTDVLKIRYAAGYDERQVTYNRWTPLVRLSVHEDEKRGAFILLDNTSASEVVQTEARARSLGRSAHRSMVYRFQDDPDARVAILAASAGPEVSVAQSEGYSDITAIDIAGDINEIVRTKFPDAPHNPYLQDGLTWKQSDGRAAILHAEQPFDIIHMVHANLWSSAGLLANAWSPSLLETAEAFETYLDKLTPDGTLSFGRGTATDAIARSAVEALKRRGAKEPWKHISYTKSSSTVLLVKPRPFTDEELARLETLWKDYRVSEHRIDPRLDKPDKAAKEAMTGPVMTDDRPYLDSPDLVWRHVTSAFKKVKGESEEPLAAIYRSVVIQWLFVLVAGVLFLGLPLLLRARAGIQGLTGSWAGLLYVCCLGYGYLAVETVLIHELVLFVGHPTYAVTVVILAMLLSSGIGSVVAGRVGEERKLRVLQGALVATLVLGGIIAFPVTDLLHATALGLPLTVRGGLTFLVLLPLGFVMGMPFPMGLRLLREEASGLVPWAWALNGWMSVVASLATVVVSRVSGYSTAFVVALSAYVLALVLAGTLSGIRMKTAE